MNLLDIYSENELKIINVNHLGLRKTDWNFKRGARTEQKYSDPENLNIYNATEVYSNTWSQDGRRLIDFTRELQWLNDDNSLIIKVDTTPIITAMMLEEIMESIWKRQVRYLVTAARELYNIAQPLPEPLKTQYETISTGVNTILNHYSEQIAKYESHGLPDFENSVNNETDAEILALLELPVRPADDEFPNGLTAKESIIHQLTGVIP